MLLHIRSVIAVAILLLGLMPAWSKTERVVLRGNTFVFEIPDDFTASTFNKANGDTIEYDSNDMVLTFGYEPGPFDLKKWVIAAGPLEHSNSVSIKRSTTMIEMAASTSSCGGKCFIVVKITNIVDERSETDVLFKRYVRALDTRSFEQSAAR